MDLWKKMPLLLNENKTQENVSDESKQEMLWSFWEEGFHLIPCGSRNEIIPEYFRKRHPFESDEVLAAKWAKTPRVKWETYQRRQPTQDELREWLTRYPGANWAAITGITFVVLDCDSQEAVEFVESGQLTRSPLKQRTPRGGYHYFYQVNEGLNVRNTTGKLDVRGEGGYVMVSPSRNYGFETPEGAHIRDVDDLPMLNMNDLNTIHEFNQSGKVQPIGDGKKITLDPVGVGQRNDTLARLVGKWIREGWGYREVLIKAFDWNQTLQPPLPLPEVLQTVMSITQGHVKRNPEDTEAGIMSWKTSEWQIDLGEELKEILDQEDPIVVQKEQDNKEDPLGLKAYNDEFWTGIESGTIEQYWGDCFIFEQSRCLLIGKPKIGKSHWLGAFAAAATTGQKFMGMPFTKPCKVMWLQAEIIQEFLKNRIDTYYQPYAHDPDLMALGHANLIPTGRLRKNIMRDKDINAIAESIDYHQPDIVMIDPIINFFDGEENSNQEIHSLLSRVDRLIELFGVAVIIAHHTGKERADDASFMSARGGSAFAGWMDSGIKLMGQRPNVTMFYEARNAREPETHLARFDFEKGFWDTVDFDQGPDEVEIAQKVADAMDRTKFYTRQDLEMLAREALKANNLPSGERAARYAVSHVQKYLGDVVKTKAIPGKQTWHYRFDNKGRKPWED